MTMIANTVTINPEQESTMTLYANQSEMLRIAKDGFYVRGVKIDQDQKEAEKVYTAFHQWLTWATLNRSY